MASRQCQFCGAAVTLADPIPRDSSCESCQRDYRSCRQCRHYDPSRHNQCRQTAAEMVEDKERRNFCEFFDFRPAPYRPGGRDAGREAQARAKLEGLFGGKPTTDRATDARAKLEGLFKKSEEKDDVD